MLNAKRQKELNDILFSPITEKDEPLHKPNNKFSKQAMGKVKVKPITPQVKKIEKPVHQSKQSRDLAIIERSKKVNG